MATMIEGWIETADKETAAKKRVRKPWEIHAKAMRELQKEWATDLRHVEQRYTECGIQSSQISALVMYLIKKGVLK